MNLKTYKCEICLKEGAPMTKVYGSLVPVHDTCLTLWKRFERVLGDVRTGKRKFWPPPT